MLLCFALSAPATHRRTRHAPRCPGLVACRAKVELRHGHRGSPHAGHGVRSDVGGEKFRKLRPPKTGWPRPGMYIRYIPPRTIPRCPHVAPDYSCTYVEMRAAYFKGHIGVPEVIKFSIFWAGMNAFAGMGTPWYASCTRLLHGKVLTVSTRSHPTHLCLSQHRCTYV